MIEIKHRFTEEVLHVLSEGPLAGANLAGAALSSADFAGLDLRGANLQGAGLSAADFTGAILSGCNLRGADLSGAVLIGAYLGGADLREGTLAGTDLGHAGLEDADLSGVDLKDTNLIGSDLSRARLQGANLAGVSMKYATLDGAAFDDRTQFPPLLFDPEARGARRIPLADPQLPEAAWDAGQPVIECLFQRAADGVTLSLHVRTAGGWLPVDRPTEGLAGQLLQALGAAGAEARAYRVGSAVGLIVRARR